jgi:glycosyltransferase involved in cell wall biosynthesis
MTPRKSVLFVVNDLGFFFSHRLALAQAAIAAGYEVGVATPKSVLQEKLSRLGIVFHELEMSRSGQSPIQEVLTLLRIYKLFKKIKPDLVHLVTVKPIVYGGIAARLAGVRGQVAAVPGLGFAYSSNTLRARLVRPVIDTLYRLALRHSNSITIFQNNTDRARFEDLGIADPKSTVLIRGSGVDLSDYNPNSTSSDTDAVPLVILACRMLYDKGVETFVNSAKQLRLQHPTVKARFALIGGVDSHNPSGVTERQLKEWNDEGHIEWWGQRDDMPKIFAKCAIVCLPSVYGEGVPKVLIEACACAKPIVAMNIAGSKECVDQGLNGFLVKPGDQVGFTEAILKLLLDPTLRYQMGLHGRKKAEQLFDVKEVAKTTLGLYEQLLSNRTQK